MNDLETLFHAEVRKQEIDKRTVDELGREQRRAAHEFCEQMVDKLQFLSNVGCRVYISKNVSPGYFFVDYTCYNKYSRTAALKLKWERKRYEEEYYTYYHIQERFDVDWNYHVCDGSAHDYLTTEEFIKRLAKIVSNR